jgi:outer membrane protein
MHNRLLQFIAVLCALCLHVGAIAQGAQAAQATTATPKIGLANLNRILAESETAKSLRASLEKEFNPRIEALRKQGESLKAAQADLEKNAPTLSEGQLQQRQRDLVAQNTDFERRKRELDEDYSERQREVTAEFNTKVTNVVRRVAVDEHYDMMFQEAVWWNPAIDITDKIIKELDSGRPAKAR